MLEIRNVHKTFNPGTINEKHALNGVNLKLEEGAISSLLSVETVPENRPCSMPLQAHGL